MITTLAVLLVVLIAIGVIGYFLLQIPMEESIQEQITL